MVVVGIIAEFSSEGCGFVTLLSEELPALVVVAVVVFTHEGVVEIAETKFKQRRVVFEGAVLGICRVDGDAPCGFFEPFFHAAHELGLEFLGGESLAEDEGTAVNVVFRPEAEAGLDEGQTGIGVVSLGEATVEFLVETLELFAAPVREISGFALALALCFFVAWPALDIVWNGAGFPYIGVAETYHQLVSSGSNLFQQFVHGRPVEDIFLLADVTV